jgi:hypothetical protein
MPKPRKVIASAGGQFRVNYQIDSLWLFPRVNG